MDGLLRKDSLLKKKKKDFLEFFFFTKSVFGISL